MFSEAVILAGGFGTRLAHVLGNVPKPMAPIHGKPFLTYLLEQLEKAGVQHIILATGYKHEVIESYFGSHYRSLKVSYSEENIPLFTGGAILKASKLVEKEDFLVLNGDTLFDIDLEAFYNFHTHQQASVSLALRKVDDTARYGAVQVKGEQIIAFQEKNKSKGQGVINGGVYAINKKWLQQSNLPEKFSFEKEVLEQKVGTEAFYGKTFTDYFIDIGVPEDYYKAQMDFGSRFATNDRFLFLDRDGVLNRRIVGDYVRSWKQWEWLPNALQSVANLSQKYNRVFVVTNQQGIGKGLFTMHDVDEIHQKMVAEVQEKGGKMDKIYVCGDLKASGSLNRKPSIGMALQAQADFPEVDFTRSVMVGDSVSDMQFGWRAGMRCVFLTNNEAVPPEVRDYTDMIFSDLQAIASR